MRYCFIVNPVAGAGKCDDKFDRVRALMDERGAEYEYTVTEYPGHAVILAREAADTPDTVVVAVGGDGTTKEVASGLYGTAAKLCVFPFGTGNDLSKALGLPLDPEGCVDMLLAGKARRMDLGLMDGKLFINVAGFGFDVDVLINTERYKKKYTGLLPYMLGIFSGLAGIHGYDVAYAADGGVTDSVNAVLVAVGNGTHFGGGMKVCPNADPFDGLFDVCIIEDMSIFRLLPLLPGFIKGRHIKNKAVRYFRTERLKVTCHGVPSVELDGEVMAHMPGEFVIQHEAMEMIVKE